MIFFDEPTSALVPELQDEVLKVMRELVDAGMTMLVVTHEPRFARQAADQVVSMENGVITEDSSKEAFCSDDSGKRIHQLLYCY